MPTAIPCPACPIAFKRSTKPSSYLQLKSLLSKPARVASRVVLVIFSMLACQTVIAVDMITGKNQDPASLKTFSQTETLEKLAETSAAITPFRIDIPDSALVDLRLRLEMTRLPDQISGTSWEYGTDLTYLKQLLDYWRDDFDWRAQEELLNQFNQFKTKVDDIDLHFIHQRSAQPDAIPLLLVHGWPGSISEFTKIIGPLADPAAHGGGAEDAFHVIAPSLPGFGFSSAPAQPGYGPEQMALALAALMARLGYERYALAGGDWGAIINRHLANHFPDRLIGLHSNMVLAGAPSDPALRDAVPESEAALVEARRNYMLNEVGYQQIQGTKPQTLGYGLNDSPAGLAA